MGVNLESKAMLRTEVAVERSSLVEKICSSVTEYISEAELGAGDKLPAEAKLAERFGVSRLALREALVRLKALGLIEARHGLGWFVRKFEPSDCFRQLSPMLRHFAGADLEQIMETRIVLEPMVAMKVAGEISEDGLERLQAAMGGMAETVLDRESFIEHDMAFHSTLAEECGNTILTVLCAMLTDLSRRAQWAYRNTAEDREQSVAAHREILKWIEANEPQKARQAMWDHIRAVWGKLEKLKK